MGAVFEAIAHERVVERVKEGKATNQSIDYLSIYLSISIAIEVGGPDDKIIRE
jgi:hypothetical protein